MVALGFQEKTNATVHMLFKSLLVPQFLIPHGLSPESGAGHQSFMERRRGWTGSGEFMMIFATYQTIAHWESSSRCSSTQCPTSPLGAAVTVPNGRTLESLLDPSHTRLWVLFSADWSSKSGLPSYTVCKAPISFNKFLFCLD